MESFDGEEDSPQESAILPGVDAYAQYFKLQDTAFRLLMECVKSRSQQETFEATFIEDMLGRLRYTMAALRMKHAFPDPTSSRGNMHVDLDESGFPNHYDITALDADLVDRDSILKDIPSAKSLGEAILKSLLEDGEEPMRLLETRAKRAYLEMLDLKKIFVPYTMGSLARWQRKEEDGMRSYIMGWGCYDPNRNITFLYIMYFEQDASQQPLEEFGENFDKLQKVVRMESYHSPERLNLLATGIDEALEPIHPKLIKRIRIGPLFTPLLINERPSEKRTDAEITILDLFHRSRSDNDFALLFNEEIISSKTQVRERGFFKRIAREVFYVPELDDGAAEVGSSRVHRYLLMPHRVYQAISPEDIKHLPRYNERFRFSYDNKEQIHEIG